MLNCKQTTKKLNKRHFTWAFGHRAISHTRASVRTKGAAVRPSGRSRRTGARKGGGYPCKGTATTYRFGARRGLA